MEINVEILYMKANSSKYEDTIRKLNTKSLRNTLEVTSMLSCIEFQYKPVLSVLNCEVIRLLSEAIVKSKALWYKTNKITSSDLSTLINGTIDALSDTRIMHEVISGEERQKMLYGLQRYFSRVAYLQIRPQNITFIPLAQLYAIIDVLPKQCWDQFPEFIQDDIKEFPSKVTDSLGATAQDILLVHYAIINYFLELGNSLVERMPEPIESSSIDVKWQSSLLSELLINFDDYLDCFRIELNTFEKKYGKKVANLLHAYGNVFGKDINNHRNLLSQPEYNIGPEGLRLATLNRYPLIAGEDNNTWYIPNIRGFMRFIPDIIYFSITEHNRISYEKVRGYLLELYLIKMLKARTPYLVIIPEEKWLSNKGEKAGPDIIIIDHGVNPCVIGVEVKSRRMLLSTKFELYDDDLTDNYIDLWKAIKNMPEKINKVFDLVGGYQKYKEDLIKALEYPRFYLGLTGETPFVFGKMALYQSKNNKRFPLYDVNEPWTVMSVEAFEHFVEVVVQYNQTLAVVLKEYFEDCADMETTSTMEDSFRNRDIDEKQSFALNLFLEHVSSGIE